MRKAESSGIRVEGDAMIVGDGPAPLTITLGDVQAVTFFKNLLIGADLICCEIGWGDRPNLLVSEETSGWNDLMLLFRRLPGFDPNWREKVVEPPFVENRKVMFRW